MKKLILLLILSVLLVQPAFAGSVYDKVTWFDVIAEQKSHELVNVDLIVITDRQDVMTKIDKKHFSYSG